jgi:hypothetical protein
LKRTSQIYHAFKDSSNRHGLRFHSFTLERGNECV